MSPRSDRLVPVNVMPFALAPASPAMSSALHESPEVRGDGVALQLVLADRDLHSVYQPIVELDTGATVAYEALARGPQGTALERPDLLFAEARRAGRLSEVDAACQEAALTGARIGGLKAPWTLFVNIEPEATHAAMLAPPTSDDDADAAGPADDFRVVVELTERALVGDPARLLQLVARIRARGWGIALDDVGADRSSLALLPLLRPDVIKLDLRLVQQRPSEDIAQIVSAVNAEAERSGTVVLAEGIETDEHLHIALSFGASLGQGWLLGRPAPLPDSLPQFSGRPIAIVQRGGIASEPSPFALGASVRTPRLGRKLLLIEISKHLERQVIAAGESAVVLSTFQDASFFTPATRRRYSELAAHAAFVGVLGEGMPPEPLAGVRGSLLSATDPLVGEWDVVVVGPHFAATLVAIDSGDGGPDNDRRFHFVLSHDRELAIEVALTLMSRVWPDR